MHVFLVVFIYLIFMEDFQSTSVKSCVKVFLCSNPEDFLEERRALREDVFPRVRDYCRRTHRLEFRVIDPYEGIDPQDVLDPREQQVRLQLLEDCRKTSAGPFLVALVGRQYGSTGLPVQVEVSEFLQVLQTGQQMGVDTHVLEHWYERDENTIPPSFCLVDHHHDQADGKPRTNRRDTYQEMRTIFHTIVTRCIQEGSVTSEKAQKYFRSALDEELHFALENRSREDIGRCLCYIDKITRKPRQRESVTDLNINSNLKTSSDDPLSNLCDHFLSGLVTSCQLQVYTSMSECELHLGVSRERRWYTEGLCQQLYTDLLRLIDCTVAKEMHRFEYALSQELSQQANLCNIYSSLYRVNCEEVHHVKAYLKQKETKYPLILFGGPCTGKTVLLAYCANQVHTWLDGRDPVVVVHFINSSNSTMEQLLTSICKQLAISYDQPQHQLPWNVNQLRKALTNLLIMASSLPRPLVLIVDGLDQVPGADALQSTCWLPASLPVNVKLLISTAPKKSGTLEALKAFYPESSSFLEVKSKDGKDCSRMLKDLLFSCSRRITSGQQMHVNHALKECSLPLYIELLHRQACNWSSSLNITEESIIKGVHDSIRMFLAQLEQEHGKEMVSKAVCYLTLAKLGITEAELTDILSCENDVLSQYLPAGKVIPYRLRVPEAKVEAMLLALRGFLMKRNISGFQVLFWPSRHFPLVIHKLYLCSAETVKETHSTLADYFGGHWAYGRTKPMPISRDRVTQTEPLSTSGVKTYTDRQIPGQPWVYESSSKQMDVNVRKLLELPFHLKKSGRIEELVREVMMSPGFHQGMLRVGHLEDLVSDLKETSKFMPSKELGFLARIIQDAACLRDCPSGLTAVMQAKLFPYLNVLPELVRYAKQIYQEGVRTQGVNVLCSPVAPVLSTCWTLPDVNAFPIMEVLDTQCDTLFMILHDGSIWEWNENFAGGYKPFHLPELSISNITSEGNFLLLSTKYGRILLYYLKEPFNICELDTERSAPSSSTDPDFTPGGFLFSRNRIILWYKGRNDIQIFDKNTGTKLKELHCHKNVTCMSYSYDGQFLFCGQDTGTVSIFDLQDNSHLSTCTRSMETAIVNVLCCEEKHLMVCVDRIGNVFVWNISSITNPKLRKEFSSTNDQEEVLNTEHSVETSIFLVCKRYQIILWDTHDWTVDDQFKAPKDKTFIQAVLAKEGLLIIACLDNCPVLLVWKRTTGQCVLSLNIGHSKILKLFKMGSTLLAVSVNGIITTWDMDFIWSASAISKTGVKVEKLVVESTGEHFYTMDGTELLWKWSMLSNKAEGYFCHNGPVDTFTVSMDCKHLVSASSGEIYVWQTATGENLHRIEGCHSSSLLITPKGNLAVSLCEHNLSSVWNLKSGHVVCNVNLNLKNAVISPESTFILGLHNFDLLAVSLWSGYISKRFSCSGQSKVIAFQPLLDYPDYVALITMSGNLYTWKVTEETVCKHVKIPGAPLIKPELFQLSSDGNYAVLSTSGATINILDTANGKLCSLQAEGDILMICLDMTGHYIALITNAANPDDCDCDLHSQPVLSAVRISTGKTVGRFYLCKVPSSLSLSEKLCAYVAFVDGSVGVYAISDAAENSLIVGQCLGSIGQQRPRLSDEPHCWLPLEKPNITWIDPHIETL